MTRHRALSAAEEDVARREVLVRTRIYPNKHWTLSRQCVEAKYNAIAT